MNIWETLEIGVTADKKEIKRAYAKMAAKYHPEEFPEKFKEVYEAYKCALKYAEYRENAGGMRDGKMDVMQVEGLPPFRIERKTISKESNHSESPKQDEINWPDIHRETTAQEEDASNDTKMEQPDFAHLMGKNNQRSTASDLETLRKGEQSGEGTIDSVVSTNYQKNEVARVEQKFQESKIDFKKVEAKDEEEKFENITKCLISRFKDLIIKNKMHNSDQWQWLLKTQDFQRVSRQPDFLRGFTTILRGVSLAKRDAKATFTALDFGTVEHLYGKQYDELKNILLNAMRAGNQNYTVFRSGMTLEDVLAELTVTKILHGIFYVLMLFKFITIIL